MKIRNGFVSNSSSSSFCIFGLMTTQDDLGLDDDVRYEIDLYTEIEKINPEIEFYDDEENIFLGKSWSDIGDKETGKGFKASIKKDIKDIFAKLFPNAKIDNEDFKTHESIYPS